MNAPAVDPRLIVDAAIRAVVASGVPVTIRSVERAAESAARLLRDLGVEAADRWPVAS